MRDQISRYYDTNKTDTKKYTFLWFNVISIVVKALALKWDTTTKATVLSYLTTNLGALKLAFHGLVSTSDIDDFIVNRYDDVFDDGLMGL